MAVQMSHAAGRPKHEAVLMRSWRPSVLTWLIGALILGGAGVLLYPSAASWISSYNQSQIIQSMGAELAHTDPDADVQLRLAERYNAALTAGVEVVAGVNVPVDAGSFAGDAADASYDYDEILRVNPAGLMARVKVPSIGVDLPIYHGTSDAVLLRGAGHLEGSHLPIGGAGTHAVITAHRGLASATMFTNLDQVSEGDVFTIETFGEVLTYRVISTRVVAPDDTESLRAEPGEDLVTLITCTPLGINSHRILVTGERVTPTPRADIEAAGAAPDVPGFPWWAVWAGAAVLVAAELVRRGGLADGARRV